MRAPISVDVVGASVCQVFQAMYFSEAGYCGAGCISSSVPETSVRFTGNLNGEFRVAVSETLASQMTADFLAIEPDESSPEQIEAIVGEFADITCDATLSAWRPNAGFHYSVPEPLRNIPAFEELTYCFSISGEAADLGFEIQID